MDRQDLAIQCKRRGMNCCQAVLCAFEDRTDLTREQLLALGSAFGGGMGGMEGTCGALVAAEMLLGMGQYEGRPMGGAARRLHEAFEEQCGATLCKDLKGRDTGTVLCSCDDCVRRAAALVDALGQ